MSEIVTVIALSLAAGSASFLICLTEITKPLRVAVAGKSARPFWMWLSKLIQCPYCTGTWLAIFATAIYRPRITHEFYPLDLLVTMFVMNGLALLSVLIIRKGLGK